MFKNIILILLAIFTFFIYLKDGSVLQAKDVVTRWKYVYAVTMDTPDGSEWSIHGKEIIIPRENILYIIEK